MSEEKADGLKAAAAYAVTHGPWFAVAYVLWGQFTTYLDFNRVEMKQQTESLETLTELQKVTVQKLDKIEERQKETTGAVRATMP